jgi:hypothetical protein
VEETGVPGECCTSRPDRESNSFFGRVLVTPIFSFPCFKNSKLALFLGSESTFFQLEMLNFDSIYFNITWFYLREFRGHISMCSIYKGD